MPTDPGSIEAVILALAHPRGAGKTICPSEAARRLAAADPDAWRALLPAVREAAARLRDRGLVATTQHGRPVDPRTVRGPIRLGLPPED